MRKARTVVFVYLSLLAASNPSQQPTTPPPLSPKSAAKSSLAKMDYGRMSIARSSGNNNNNRSRQPDEGDAFMTLVSVNSMLRATVLTILQPDKEIAGCIHDVTMPFGMSFTLADLQKPNPQQIQKIFEMLLDCVMNMTRDVVAPAMRAAAEDMVGPEADRIYTSDTRDLMAFFVLTRKLLAEVRGYMLFK
jgi:kinetochore protein Nuf2